MLLILIGIDVSKVFLAQRALAAAADDAAVAAAQGVDVRAVYSGAGLTCGTPLPLDPDRAAAAAAQSVDDNAADLRHDLASVDAPQTTVTGGTASVQLKAGVGVPFGRVLHWLDPSRSDGLIHISETSHARSPAAGAGC